MVIMQTSAVSLWPQCELKLLVPVQYQNSKFTYNIYFLCSLLRHCGFHCRPPEAHQLQLTAMLAAPIVVEVL